MLDVLPDTKDNVHFRIISYNYEDPCCSSTAFNPLAAPACKISGLKSVYTRLFVL